MHKKYKIFAKIENSEKMLDCSKRQERRPWGQDEEWCP